VTTPPSDDNPFRTPDYATPPAPMPPVPGQQAPIPHWFTTKVRVTLVACVVAALGLGALGALGISGLNRYGTPSNGDCLYLTHESGGKLAYHRAGCGSDSATFKVENTYHGAVACAAGDYVRFRLGSGTGETLCLALNVRSGECIRNIEDETTIDKLSCADPAAEERVRILPGFGQEEDCTGADKVLSYAGPPSRTVCLIRSGENI
jgi:hypothetical protein